MFKVPWVFGCAVERSLIGRTHGKFVHIGTAKSDHAGIQQVLHDSSSIRRNKVIQHFGAACTAPTCLAENIFVSNRHTGQRRCITGRDTRIGCFGFSKGLILIDGHIAIDGRVFRSNSGQIFGRQFDCGNLFGLQQAAGLFERVSGHCAVLSIKQFLLSKQILKTSV